jgi:D-alanyl-D-alanine dipeptidase
MKFLRSRKAVIFNIFIVIVTLIALIYGYIMLNDKSDIDRTIGVNQYEIFMVYQDGDKALSYLDDAADISLRNVVSDIQIKGGVDAAKCGRYYGFNTWNAEQSGCIPDTDALVDFIAHSFAAEMEPRIIAYPEITFLRYYIDQPPAAPAANVAAVSVSPTPTTPSTTTSSSTSSSSTPASTPTFSGGIVEGDYVIIPQDDQIRCCGFFNGKCKLNPTAASAVANIKQHLEPGEYVLICDALRAISVQKSAFVAKYVKNGYPPVCGPWAVRKQIYAEIGQPPNKGKVDKEYHAKVDSYLASHPEIMKIIDDDKKYLGICKHLAGEAVDLYLMKDGKRVGQHKLREIMCKAGWVNFGGEDWHFEYGSSNWQKKRPDQVPDASVGNPKDGNYNEKCYYGGLK